MATEREPAQPQDRAVAPLPVSADPLTILVMGTSLSAGTAWPDRAARLLTRCLGRTVGIVRLAEPGADIRWGLARLDAAVAAAPDIVLIEFATNDADILDGPGAATSARLTAELTDRLAAALPGARLVLMTMNPVNGLARRLQRPWLAAHNRDYRSLAERGGLGLVDLAPRWARLDDLDRALPDGLHPSEAAAEALILPALVPYLGRLAGGACEG